MKKTITIILLWLILTSCSGKKDASVVDVKSPVNNITESKVNNIPSSDNSSIPQKSINKRNEVLLEPLKKEDKDLLISYEKESISWNLEKRDLLLNQINEIIKTKEQQSLEANANWDAEKSKQLNDELRAFKIFSRKK